MTTADACCADAAARAAFNKAEANTAEKLATLCQDAANIQAWISKAMSMQVRVRLRIAQTDHHAQNLIISCNTGQQLLASC